MRVYITMLMRHAHAVKSKILITPNRMTGVQKQLFRNGPYTSQQEGHWRSSKYWTETHIITLLENTSLFKFMRYFYVYIVFHYLNFIIYLLFLNKLRNTKKNSK